MASIGISEFMFGYAFLYEQTHSKWGSLIAAPVLPSLYEEKDKGWDAHLPTIGTDFYYQFKLSERLAGGNAKYIKDGTYTSSYYRIALYRKENNRQHQRLKTHAISNPHTYYVAPEFDTVTSFNAAFLARQITDQSRMIPVADCDEVIGSAQHYITYRSGYVDWNFHSEARRHERSFLGRDLEKVYKSTQSNWRPIDRKFGEQLYERTIGGLRTALQTEESKVRGAQIPLLDFNPRQAETRDVLARVAQALSVALGATLVLVGTKKE